MLACLAAAYATKDPTPIDKTVGPEIKQYLRHKECVLNECSEAYAKAAEDDPSACPALYKVYRAAEKDYKSTERIINLQGEPSDKKALASSLVRPIPRTTLLRPIWVGGRAWRSRDSWRD